MLPQIEVKKEIRYNTNTILNFIAAELKDIRKIKHELSVYNDRTISLAKQQIVLYNKLKGTLFQDFKKETALARAQIHVLINGKCRIPFYKISERRKWKAETQKAIADIEQKIRSTTFNQWLKTNHNIEIPSKYVDIVVIPTMDINNMSVKCDIESYFLMAQGRISCMSDDVINNGQLIHDQIFFWKYRRENVSFCVWPEAVEEFGSREVI